MAEKLTVSGVTGVIGWGDGVHPEAPGSRAACMAAKRATAVDLPLRSAALFPVCIAGTTPGRAASLLPEALGVAQAAPGAPVTVGRMKGVIGIPRRFSVNQARRRSYGTALARPVAARATGEGGGTQRGTPRLRPMFPSMCYHTSISWGLQSFEAGAGRPAVYCTS